MNRFAQDPALWDEEQLIARFCVRQELVSGLLAALAQPGPPLWVRGPRGAGCSMLLARLVPELRRVGGVVLLRGPLVSSIEELWYEAGFSDGRPEVKGRFTLLIDDADALPAAVLQDLERALAGSRGLRALCAGLGPWSGLLAPLVPAEVMRLWADVRGEPLLYSRAAVVAALTGGCPRLVAQWAAQPARDLRGRLMGVLDANADRFQGMIASITSPDSRRVFLELAALRAPSTARQVAEKARFDVNKTSTLLGRLVAEGQVTAIGGGRARTYRVSERLLSLYVCARRYGEAPIAPLLAFGEALAEPRKVAIPRGGAGWEDRGLRGASGLAPRKRPDARLRELLGEAVSHEEFQAPELPKRLKKLAKEPEELLPLLEREAGWADAGAAALLRSWKRGETSLAGRLGRALIGWLDAEDPMRAACAVAMARIGELGLAEQGLGAAGPRWGLLREALRAAMGRPARPEAGDSALHGVLAAMLIDQPEHREACLGILRQAADANPAAEGLRLELGEALFRVGRPDEAVRALLAGPAPGPALFALAQEGMQGVDLDAAIELARARVAAHPSAESVEALYRLGGELPPDDAIPRLCEEDFVRENLGKSVLMAMDVARAGEIRALHDALEQAPSAPLLEPLLVALRKQLGLPTGAPQEVEDLADEVLRRISSRSPGPSDRGSPPGRS